MDDAFRPMSPDEQRWMHALRARFDGLSFVAASMVKMISRQGDITEPQAKMLRSIAESQGVR